MSIFEGEPDFSDALNAAVLTTLAVLPEDPARLGEVSASYEAFGEALDTYLARSEALTRDLAIEPGPDFSLTRERSQLYWAAVGDLLVFRGLCLLEFADALSWAPEEALIGGDEPIPTYRRTVLEERDRLVSDLETVTIGVWNAWGASGGAGPGIGVLSATVDKSVDKIVEASTSHVIEAGFGALRGLLPAAGWINHGRVVKFLRSVAHAIDLDKVLSWASRLLASATAKLHRLFGPGFHAVLDQTRESLSSISEWPDRVGAVMYQTPELRTECSTTIAALLASGATNRDLAERTARVEAVVSRYDKWSLGIDISTTALRWGGRLAALTPPVALALSAAGVAVTAGSYLIGQYHLDWPQIAILGWRTDGVLSALG